MIFMFADMPCDVWISSCRAAREQEVDARVRRYTLGLQEQRKRVGILGEPSSELLHAERRLAEVHAHRVPQSSAMVVSEVFVTLHTVYSVCDCVAALQAMVLRQEMEARAREYRLTAFTGELPLGT